MKIEELEFKQIENKIYPQKQLAYKFFISYRVMERRYVEVKPITFFNIIYSAAKNDLRIWYWSFLRFLYKAGFIDIECNDAFSWKSHFRFSFWSPKKYAR